jgi:hypothetical protein
MAAVLVGLGANAQDQKPDEVIKVNTEKYDFGKIKQSVPVSTNFVITNTTDKPIVIENAWGSCGCTTPEIPKEPIAPGASTKLKVNYNAAALNHFEKDVFIKVAGISQPKIVKITGDVLDETAYGAYLTETKGSKSTNAKSETKIKTENGKTKIKSSTKAAPAKKATAKA